MKEHRQWKAAEIRKLRREYPHRQSALIAAELGRSVTSIYRRAETEGLRKSQEFLASDKSGRLRGDVGTAARFKLGHVTWNKGMKGLQIGGIKTRFRKGSRPHNWHPIGTELVRGGVLVRKVTDFRSPARKDWKSVHSIMWEEVNGPIPADHIVVFKDRNPKNLRLDNLELVTRAENMRRNTLHRYPKEIARLMQLRGALNRQINKRMRPE